VLQPVSVIERLSARWRVRYGRFHCSTITDTHSVVVTALQGEVLPKIKIPACIIMNEYATGMTQTMHPVYPNLYHLLIYKKQKNFLQKTKGCRDGLSYSTPQKSEETKGEMPLPSLDPIPIQNVEFRDGMGSRLGNGISPFFFMFLRGGV